MGKRQTRFTGKNLITEELVGKEAQVVLLDGVVHHVRILELHPDHYCVEDFGKKKSRIPFKDIYEIILDFVSAY